MKIQKHFRYARSAHLFGSAVLACMLVWVMPLPNAGMALVQDVSHLSV